MQFSSGFDFPEPEAQKTNLRYKITSQWCLYIKEIEWISFHRFNPANTRYDNKTIVLCVSQIGKSRSSDVKYDQSCHVPGYVLKYPVIGFDGSMESIKNMVSDGNGYSLINAISNCNLDAYGQ